MVLHSFCRFFNIFFVHPLKMVFECEFFWCKGTETTILYQKFHSLYNSLLSSSITATFSSDSFVVTSKQSHI